MQIAIYIFAGIGLVTVLFLLFTAAVNYYEDWVV